MTGIYQKIGMTAYDLTQSKCRPAKIYFNNKSLKVMTFFSLITLAIGIISLIAATGHLHGLVSYLHLSHSTQALMISGITLTSIGTVGTIIHPLFLAAKKDYEKEYVEYS